MECEGAKELLLNGEVLHELRGQFHKVPKHIGARKTLETGVGKHAVKRVAELMQECLHLSQRQKRWFLGGGLREIHHHTYMRSHVHSLAVDELSLVFGHPCSSLLALAGVEVGIEHGEERTIAVEHLVCFHVGMIHRNVFALLERNAVEAVGKSEHAVDNL